MGYISQLGTYRRSYQTTVRVPLDIYAKDHIVVHGKPHEITENNSNLYFQLLMFVRAREILYYVLYITFYILCKY